MTEIRIAVRIMQIRKYQETARSILASLEREPTKTCKLSVVAPEILSPVFKGNLDKIGLLPNEIRNDVVMFHQWLEAMVCDVRSDKGLFATDGGDLEGYRQLNQIYDEAMSAAKRILDYWDTRHR